MELYKEKSYCCGCTACVNVCPNKAIKMERDEEGFLYPSIDQSRCVECGACVRICAFKTQQKENTPLMCLAAKNKDEQIRLYSSSGGVFTAMYNQILQENGVVYGVKFDKDFCAIYGRAETKEECQKFRGSKYVQSDVGNVFKEIKNDLNNNKPVLFTGTPCHVDGLKKYLRNDNTENLFLCDIVCHGTPSPLIWQNYLKIIGGKEGIQSVSFREKKYAGWHKSQLNIKKNNGNELCEGHNKNAFSLLYFNHYILRPACHICPYANLHRVGDVTIGDFWGIENSMPDFDDDKGVSLLLVNTERGNSLLRKIQSKLYIKESDTENCLQPNLCKPSAIPDMRIKFWTDYHKKGLNYVMKKYTKYGDNYISIRCKKRFMRLCGYMKNILRHCLEKL